MNRSVLFIIIVTITGVVSCSKTRDIEDNTNPIVFANNKVIETALKSIEQTSFWSEGDTLGVYATESELFTFTFMDQNTKVTFNNLNGWSYDNPSYWTIESQKFTFFAYFPYVSEGGFSKPTLIDDSGGRFNIEYGVNENVKLQEDLLWDWIIDANELFPSGEKEGNGINTSFAFQHALSKVKFRIKAAELQTIYITSLSLTAYGNGLFSTIRTDGHKDSTMTTPTWEIRDTLMTFSLVDKSVPNVDNKYGYVVDTKPRDIGFIITRSNKNDADYELLMIPQAKTGIKISLSYNILNNYIIGDPVIGEVYKEFEDIDFQYDWLLGHQYMYNINIDMEDATLTTSEGKWNAFDEII